MKKVIVWLLCAAMFACIIPAGCTAAEQTPTPDEGAAPTSDESAAPTPVVEPEASATTAPSTVTTSNTAPVKQRQYGEAQELVVDQNGFAGQIIYPAGDIEAIDTVILEWVSLTMTQYEKEVAEAESTETVKATINVDYESFEFSNRFVGIEEYGTYTLHGTDQPSYLLYTFNYDLNLNKPLALSEVIDETHMDAIIAMVQKQLTEANVTNAGTDGVLTEDDMHQFVIRDDGIEWLFLTDTGIVGTLISYNDILPYLIMLTEATPAPTVTPAPTTAEKPAIEQTAVCTHDGSHIRSGPGTEYDLVATISANTELEVVKSNATSGWHEIWYNGQTAYIAASLVRLASEPQNLTTGWVESNYVHVRAGAGTQYEVIGTLKYQDKVEIIKENFRGNWHKIWFNNQVAYVYAKYVHIGSTPENTPDPSAATPAPTEVQPPLIDKTSISVAEVGTCTTNGVIVRSARSTQSDYYGKLNAGMQVYVLAYGETWCEVYVPVSNSNGYIGYVHTKYLNITTPDVTEAQDENPKIVIGMGAGVSPDIGNGATVDP